jgi:hypothetical protein
MTISYPSVPTCETASPGPVMQEDPVLRQIARDLTVMQTEQTLGPSESRKDRGNLP